MARRLYSLVTRGLWSDARFLALSPPPPNARTLWLYLLTGDLQGPIPGLFRAGVGTIADGLGWSFEDVAETLGEIERAGLLYRSDRPPLVWLPNAVRHNPPASPNVVVSWKSAFVELPECELRELALRAIRGGLRGDAFVEAFDRTFPEYASAKPSRKASRKPFRETLDELRESVDSTTHEGSGVRGHASSDDSATSDGDDSEKRRHVERETPRKTSRKPSRKASSKPCANQEQEQEQELSVTREAAARLAVLLRESIRAHSPNVAEKYELDSKLEPWTRDLERLLRIDRASEQAVRAVIRWAHVEDNRGFWRGNLLSGAKVRKHFDQLSIQARQSGATVPSATSSSPSKSWLEEHHSWALRVFDESAALGVDFDERTLLALCKRDDVAAPTSLEAITRWIRGRR